MTERTLKPQTEVVYGFTSYGPEKYREYHCEESTSLDGVMRELRIALEDGAREAVVNRTVRCTSCHEEVRRA